LDGFLNIDKPRGMTSFDVIRRIKQIIPRGIKIGHLGTLDPMASGVLPIAMGKATRVIPYIDDERKVYIAQLTLGVTSDTQDAWGEISYTGNTNFHKKHLENILKDFTGRLKQIPPMYSAVHYQGKRLYELAREGKTVAREERYITVYELRLLEINQDTELPVIKIQVDCSRGTYVRTLAHDIGTQLGTGALMSGLIRIRSGNFSITEAHSLEKILENKQRLAHYLLPLDHPIQHLPTLNIDSEQDTIALSNGQAIVLKDKPPEGLMRVYAGDKLLALARSYEGSELIKAERVFK
jgi:tRNA pseudouridine55 synthase